MFCGLFSIVPHFSHFCEGFLLLLISMFKMVCRHSAEVLSSVPKQESCDVPYGKKYIFLINFFQIFLNVLLTMMSSMLRIQ